MEYCVGVDVGGTTVKFGLFTKDGELEEKWEIVTRREESGKYILEDIADSYKQIIKKKNIAEKDVIGIGVGIAGPITLDGTVLKCANLGWGVFNVADEVKRLTGVKNVKVANDANVAALGEMWMGGGKGYQSILMITLGTGVGGGVIINGEIVAGSKGAAGEIGHITVRLDEEDTCGCGKRGCLEQYASATGLVKEAGRLLQATDQPSKLREAQYLSAKTVFDAAKANDELAIKLVEQMCSYLGLVCSHAAAVADPEAFVIGGGVSQAGEMLTDTIQKYYEKNVIYALKGRDFKLARLGNDAGIYGCAKMILK